MKVSDLKGATLDYWVARCDGLPLSSEWACCPAGGIFIGRGVDGDPHRQFDPSARWEDGGPIIEREQMTVWHRIEDETDDFWNACIELRGGVECTESGPTLLVAAMRAYVASKFGAEVEGQEL